MPLADVVLLTAAGLAAGFVAGLVGVGGGIIFVPILLFYLPSIGVPPEVVPAVTVGTSLLCTMVTSGSSAWFHYRRDAVDGSLAVRVGLASIVAVFLTSRFITTQPWYDARIFQLVFAAVLLVVVARMTLARSELDRSDRGVPGFLQPLGVGTAAGTVSAAVGVGGGVVLVPAYNRLLSIPIRRAVGTSSATIIIISALGVATHAVLGLDAEQLPATAIGYVDFGRGALLALPAAISARLGVVSAHGIRRSLLRRGFAVVAAVVAIRLVVRALN